MIIKASIFANVIVGIKFRSIFYWRFKIIVNNKKLSFYRSIKKLKFLILPYPGLKILKERIE